MLLVKEVAASRNQAPNFQGLVEAACCEFFQKYMWFDCKNAHQVTSNVCTLLVYVHDEARRSLLRDCRQLDVPSQCSFRFFDVSHGCEVE